MPVMPKMTMKHASWVSSNSFDAIGVTYEMNSPIWFYKYFMSEANYGAVTAGMMDAFNLLFELTPCAGAAQAPRSIPSTAISTA
jgi:hypothetical protein